MHFYQLTIAYDGTNFFGSAFQKNLRTVEGELRKVFSKLCHGDNYTLVFAGRTDKGVHAKQQVISLAVSKKIAYNRQKFLFVLNRMLPDDICVLQIVKKQDFFNARFDALSREYQFYIELKPHDLFKRKYVLSYDQPIVLTRLKQACKCFLGKHDFLSFSTSEKQNTVRDLKIFNVKKKKNLIIFHLKANGFLKSQVRMMIAYILKYNEKVVTLKQLKNLLMQPKKGASLYKTSPNGLFLSKVNY